MDTIPMPKNVDDDDIASAPGSAHPHIHAIHKRNKIRSFRSKTEGAIVSDDEPAVVDGEQTVTLVRSINPEIGVIEKRKLVL